MIAADARAPWSGPAEHGLGAAPTAHHAFPTLAVDSSLRPRQAGAWRIETKKNFVEMKSPAYLNALRAFEASARHGSFSQAASELGVTAAAVGQLVRGLEDWIGSPLFHRSASGKSRLVPTEVAARVTRRRRLRVRRRPDLRGVASG